MKKINYLLFFLLFSTLSQSTFAGGFVEVESVTTNQIIAGQTYSFTIDGTSANPFNNPNLGGLQVDSIRFVSSAGSAFDFIVGQNGFTYVDDTTLTTSPLTVPAGAPTGSTYIIQTVSLHGTPNITINLCPNSICITVVTATGIENELTTNSFKLFPNPATNVLSIKTDIVGSYQIELINILGSTVLKQSVTTQNKLINIENLPKGTYFLRYSDGVNEKKTVKFIKA